LQVSAQLRHTVLVFLGLAMLIGTPLGLAVVPFAQQLGMLALRSLQFNVQHRMGLRIALALLGAVDFG
jgi:hypothetical protein